jgi:trehalose 6-phosphate synthase
VVGQPTSRQPSASPRQPPSTAAPGARSGCRTTNSQLVPQMLRELRPDLRIGFYLHIPFPPSELFVQLPWRRQILEGMLGADLVGFQLPGGRNFVRLVANGSATRPTATGLPA